MNCSKARRWFGAYWDDEITQAEREMLEAHFAACDKCRAAYEGLARTIEGLASLPRYDAAPDFVERTLARARRATPVADHLRLPSPVWAPVAVAALLLIVAATLLAPWVGRSGRPMAVRPAVPQEATLIARAHAQPPAVASPTRLRGPSQALTQEQVAALVDSLIDHSEDVDFVLDPVQVGRERTAGRRMQPVQGRQAVITF